MRGRVVALAAVLAGAAWVTTTWVLTPVTIGSPSMSPTLCDGDVVLVLRRPLAPPPGAGDVVTLVVGGEERQWIKRVVAVGGQTVGIVDGELVVDGTAVPEPYVDHRTVDGTFSRSFTVATGSVFVLGDSRERSIDSRDFGPVPGADVTGRVVGRLWSRCRP